MEPNQLAGLGEVETAAGLLGPRTLLHCTSGPRVSDANVGKLTN